MEKTLGIKAGDWGKCLAWTSAPEDFCNSLLKELKIQTVPKNPGGFAGFGKQQQLLGLIPVPSWKKSLDQAVETPPESPESLSHLILT